MIRSTDLSQIPSFSSTPTNFTSCPPPSTMSLSTSPAVPPPQPFLNEPHREMVLQKQRAADHFSLPQSSTLIQDDDDDPSVTEVARTYGNAGAEPYSSSFQEDNTPASNAAIIQDDEPSDDDEYAVSSYRDNRDYGKYDDEEDPDEYDEGTPRPSERGSANRKNSHSRSRKNTASRSRWDNFSSIMYDVKLVALVIAVFIAVSFVPVNVLIEKYTPSLMGVGYAPLLLKAAITGVAAAALIKMMDIDPVHGGGSGGQQQHVENIDGNEYTDDYEDDASNADEHDFDY